jgi:ABC-type spermidine/putrescine transport system permease subunit II
MTLGLSMPGGSEWMILVLAVLAGPILAIVYYSHNKELKKQIEILKQEKSELLSKISNK